MFDSEQPSFTALTAAAARAAHLIVDDDPPIFADTLAYRLLGDRAEELIGYHRAHGTHPVLSGARAAVTTRSRYTEDRLAEAARRGVDQYVILGAGLDTFAYRSPPPAVRVFEVDHPATRRWKLRLLAEAGIDVPDTACLVPADLEAEPLPELLERAGFDRSRPAFVSWLGVTVYLTREAVTRILNAIGGLAPGTEIVLDHILPAGMRDAAAQEYAASVMPATEQRGEPWLSLFAPEDMAALLREQGLEPAEHVSQRDAVDPSLWNRRDALRPSALSMLTRAHPPAR